MKSILDAVMDYLGLKSIIYMLFVHNIENIVSYKLYVEIYDNVASRK